MTENLHSLAYFSRSTLSASGGTAHVELGRILASARKNNVKQGVTGALIFSDDYFAQVLEGPRESINAIFEGIECDPRHSHVTIIHFKPIQTRQFSNWSMAFAKVPEAGAAQLGVNDLLNNPSKTQAYDAGRDIQALLQDLINLHGDTGHADSPDSQTTADDAPPVAPPASRET
jgi:hypothetical protein